MMKRECPQGNVENSENILVYEKGMLKKEKIKCIIKC